MAVTELDQALETFTERRKVRRICRFQDWYAAVKSNPMHADTLIVAEIGLNHGGDVDKAMRMISAAARSGADAVKFQIYKVDQLVHTGVDWMQSAVRAFTECELSFSDYRRLEGHCRDERIEFLATPFSVAAARFLFAMNPPAVKIASGDINNYALLSVVARHKVPVLLSTGASTDEEVEAAVRFLESKGAVDIVLLHCVSEYPASMRDVNFYSIPYLLEKYGYPVGFSDHTVGVEAAPVAVALGARVIEKHFVLEKEDEAIDASVSINEDQMGALVRNIRNMEAGLGSYRKEPTEHERIGNSVGRRGLYYAMDLQSGDTVMDESILPLRPQNGMPAEYFPRLIGRRLRRNVSAGDSVRFEDFVEGK